LFNDTQLSHGCVIASKFSVAKFYDLQFKEQKFVMIRLIAAPLCCVVIAFISGMWT